MKDDSSEQEAARLFDQALELQIGICDASGAYLALLKPDPARRARSDALLAKVAALLARFESVAAALRDTGQAVPDTLSTDAAQVVRALRTNRTMLPPPDAPDDCSRN